MKFESPPRLIIRQCYELNDCSVHCRGTDSVRRTVWKSAAFESEQTFAVDCRDIADSQL